VVILLKDDKLGCDIALSENTRENVDERNGYESVEGQVQQEPVEYEASLAGRVSLGLLNQCFTLRSGHHVPLRRKPVEAKIPGGLTVEDKKRIIHQTRHESSNEPYEEGTEQGQCPLQGRLDAIQTSSEISIAHSPISFSVSSADYDHPGSSPGNHERSS